MMFRARLVAAAFAAVLLAACGGGGDGGDAGGSGPGGTSTPDYALTFNANTVQGKVLSGTGAALTIDLEAEIDRTIDRDMYVSIADANGVFVDFDLTPLSATRIKIELELDPTLPPARYQGTLEVHLCYDAAGECTSPVPGSPWKLPYDIVVEKYTPTYTVTFTEKRLVAENHAGEFAPILVEASMHAPSGVGPVFPRTHDPLGPLGSNPASSTPLAGSTFSTQVNVSASLPAGDYQGDLELRLCKDPACAAEHPGSPARLPYTLKVLPAKNLTPLAVLPGAAEWAMHQGNAAHTGYVPTTLDATKFNRRWRWAMPGTIDVSAGLLPAVTADGKVYTGLAGRFQTTALQALNEADGSVAWTHDFGSIFKLNPPAVGGGKVFVATSGHQDTAMWTFAADTGAQLARVPFSSQWERYYAPTIQGGAVYTNGGSYGGLLSYSTASTTLNWFASLPQFDGWTPAVDNQRIHAFVSTSLYTIDKATGAVLSAIQDPGTQWSGYDMDSAPVIGSGGRVITVGTSGARRLIAFDTAQGSVAWSVTGEFAQSPAVAGGVVYATSNTVLHAFDEATGALRWSWALPVNNDRFNSRGGSGNVIVTDNLVFVSSDLATYAISLDTHKTVWSHPVGGLLALSPRGVLHIVAAPRGAVPAAVVAINLR